MTPKWFESKSSVSLSSPKVARLPSSILLSARLSFVEPDVGVPLPFSRGVSTPLLVILGKVAALREGLLDSPAQGRQRRASSRSERRSSVRMGSALGHTS